MQFKHYKFKNNKRRNRTEEQLMLQPVNERTIIQKLTQYFVYLK